MYETKIRDINDLRKRLMQIWFNFDQNIINAAIDQWRDHLRSCVRVDGGHFEHIRHERSLIIYSLKTSQFKTVCKDDSGYVTTKTAKIKKVILLSSTSPHSQCADK